MRHPVAAQTADSGWGRNTRPVINVGWDLAQQYAAWLSKMTGQPYRLLTEAEWEYAARAGTTTAYYWGNEFSNKNAASAMATYSWSSEGSFQDDAPVGSFARNQFGLYDMAGNVWQWVQDCHHNDYNGAPTDGSAWIEGGNCNSRVVRGGSWNSSDRRLRSANRDTYAAGTQVNFLGFRVGRTLSP
jgi:formylglycine-generating enzyme required for sulfatase activity